MGLFKKKEGGIMDVIRCDEQDYLIWKWRPNNQETYKENSIRWGSSLRVKDGSVAVFVYKTKKGEMQDFIEGPCDEMLRTRNLPVLTEVLGLAYDGKSPFQAEVYFINLANIIQQKLVVPYFDIYDSRFVDFGVPVAVRGMLTYRIDDYKTFIKLHRLDEFNYEKFKNQINDLIVRETKIVLSNVPINNSISVLQLERNLDSINALLEKRIVDELNKDFGVKATRFDIAAIDINKESEGYIQLKSVTQDITSATIKAKAETIIKNIYVDQKDYEEKLRIEREEGQYAQHMKTTSDNINAYQTEKQAEVGVAGAEALGKIVSNGGTNANLGGIGLNMAGMAAGMAMGGTLGQNMAGMFNNMNQGLNNNQQGMTPPPIPTILYHMALNNGQSAQYDINGMKNNIANGKLTKDTLVWKQGMASWAKASDVPEINALFLDGKIPPSIPNV